MTQTANINVVIVDEHGKFRHGFTRFIESCAGLSLIGKAATLPEVLHLCRMLQPHILIIEPKMRGMNGIDGIRAIHQACPDMRIVALTNCVDGAVVQAAIQAGATSYLLKTSSSAELVTAIYDAYVGKTTLAREAAQALVEVAQQPPAEVFSLTRRERDVLALMSQGRKNTEIAEHLSVSRSTVKKHVSNILCKMGTSSRTEAVAIAVQQRMVSL